MESEFKDIQAVMKKAKAMLLIIEKEYQKCLTEEEIPEDLLVDIKDYLANLRTALDYLWHKIPSAPNSHFPVANSEADFDAKTSSLDEKYAQTLGKFQDYALDSWIRCFNLFRNKNVHFTLIPQKRRETREFSIKKDGKGMKARGCTFKGNIAFGVGGVR
ncbi:hypothetical protein HN680_03055, partial [Candidatus Peregrinibacteria bacterium]|nr:hypothetical protein [Candidatus Peregrinibacteria bacterium]